MTTASTEQERFDARIAVNDADRAKNAAITAVAADVTAATTAMGKAGMYADDASDAADRAADARTDAVNASMASTEADKQETAANTAKGDADAAQTALDNAIAAYMTAVDGQDIETQDGAVAIKDAADALEKAANKAKADAETARKAAEDARDDAMEYAGKAETYEGTHVVGLLKMANAGYIDTAADPEANTDETEADLIAKNKADHVAAVNTAVKTAADADGHGGGEVAATYPYGEEGDGVPAIAVTGTGIEDAQLIHADADADPAVTANFGLGAGLGDFPHEKYITGRNNAGDDTGTRVILFTDIEQASAPTDGTSDALDNQSVPGHDRVTITADPTGTGAQGPGNTTPRMFAGTFDHDGDADTPEFTGNFICVVPSCTVGLTGTDAQGDYQAGTTVTSIAGYNFTGTRVVAPMASMADDTWLAFGVWLTETVVVDAVNTYAFGAFADGGDAVANADNIEVVTGTATYEGSAAGVHSTASEVEFFYADATLTADFGANDANGMITGEIDNIVSGGVPLGDEDANKIFLFLSDQDAQDATPSNIDTDGSFDGRTRMGTGTLGDDGEYDYPMNGTWAGNFYNPVAEDADTTAMEAETAPGSAAGTFSVGRDDDAMTTMADETESYVGAFGAHCTGSNCGTH